MMPAFNYRFLSHGSIFHGLELRKVPIAEFIERYMKMGGNCSSPRCGEKVSHFAAYDYVTGRRGRITKREIPLCQKHAEVFAKKHGLEVPK